MTKAEEQIMQVLWKINKGFIRDIMDALPSPKPHQNTVSTIAKILVEKEFIGVNIIGRNFEYYPLIKKEEYSKKTIRQITKGYFDGSYSNVVSFLVKENNISVDELEALINQIKNQKK